MSRTICLETLQRVQPALVRAGYGLSLLAALAAFAVRAGAQPVSHIVADTQAPIQTGAAVPRSVAIGSAPLAEVRFAPVQFAVGEKLD